MANNEEQKSAYDPFEAWRGMRDSYMQGWAKAMVETVNSEAYAKANGAMLDAYLNASAPLQEVMEKVMSRALEGLQMPSRADFISLAERFTNMELRLDDMDAKLDRMERILQRRPAPPPKPIKEPE